MWLLVFQSRVGEQRSSERDNLVFLHKGSSLVFIEAEEEFTYGEIKIKGPRKEFSNIIKGYHRLDFSLNLKNHTSAGHFASPE